MSQRMTGVQVVNLAQQALSEKSVCHLVLDIEVDTDVIKDALTIEVWEAPPGRIKLVVLSAVNPQLRQLAFTTDGAESVSYSPHANEVTVGPADLVKMPSVLESLVRARRDWILSADAYRARVVSIERQEGLVAYNVELPLGQGGTARYWIDARDWLVRKIAYEDDYLGRGTIHVRGAEYVDAWPDATFELSIPDGVPITEVSVKEDHPLDWQGAQMAAGFALREPRYRPPGTDFAVAYQIGQNFALLYEGPYPFTLVQGPNIGTVPESEGTVVSLNGRQATLFQDKEGGGRLLTWREDELQFSIAGNLEPEELVRIAESLE